MNLGNDENISYLIQKSKKDLFFLKRKRHLNFKSSFNEISKERKESFVIQNSFNFNLNDKDKNNNIFQSNGDITHLREKLNQINNGLSECNNKDDFNTKEIINNDKLNNNENTIIFNKNKLIKIQNINENINNSNFSKESYQLTTNLKENESELLNTNGEQNNSNNSNNSNNLNNNRNNFIRFNFNDMMDNLNNFSYQVSSSNGGNIHINLHNSVSSNNQSIRSSRSNLSNSINTNASLNNLSGNEKKKLQLILEMDEYQYKHIQKYDSRKETNCAICLEDFIGTDIIKAFTTCQHIFHKKCLLGWLKDHSICPLCKHDLSDDMRELE